MKERNKRQLVYIISSLLICTNPAFCAPSVKVNEREENVYGLPTLGIKDNENTAKAFDYPLSDVAQKLSSTQSINKTVEELSETFINNSITDVLNQKGTARFGFHNNSGRVKYDFDFLYPAYYYDDMHRIIYTQFDAHQYERDILNAGVGYRSMFDESYILGGNVFFDYDLKNRNSRIGVGAEYSYKNSALSLFLPPYFQTGVVS
ncbi:inverse autotransporter beta domain-containing protein [Escherichia coli]|uniref:inverse autotransporter beta domain-containing protein n=1 Tax=Escherichia coli TaxID=562 RepID=UPI000BE3999E|nr:inverse autotransporter beta domain-containing protein [Escherichia coli]